MIFFRDYVIFNARHIDSNGAGIVDQVKSTNLIGSQEMGTLIGYVKRRLLECNCQSEADQDKIDDPPTPGD